MQGDTPPKTKIQFASDLHLEFEASMTDFRSVVRKVDGCEALILNGDIATVPTLQCLKRFLVYCKGLWRNVFFIPGNHEYYHSSGYDAANEALRRLCEEVGAVWAIEHVHRMEDAKVGIVMCPLWSHIPEDLLEYVGSSMNDYQLCGKDFTPAFTSSLHEKMKMFVALKTQALMAEGYKVVVATHHTPLISGTSAPKYDGSDLNVAFSTDCQDIMSLGVSHWIYGHTHYNTPLLEVRHALGTTTIVSNQRGYNGRIDEESFKYDPTRFIEI